MIWAPGDFCVPESPLLRESRDWLLEEMQREGSHNSAAHYRAFQTGGWKRDRVRGMSRRSFRALFPEFLTQNMARIRGFQ